MLKAGVAAINPLKKKQKQKESQKIVSDKKNLDFKFKCKFLESAASDNGIGPTKFKVALIQEGMGNLEDAFYYTRNALESAIPIFEGKQCFIDHPDAIEEKTRPERSVKDITGWFENVAIVDGEEGQAMLVADLNILPDDDYKWVRSLLQHSVEYSQKYPDKDLVGLSINASGPADQMGLEDLINQVDIPKYALPKLQQAAQKGVSSIKLVNQLNEAMSCDLVTRAGAGGRVLEMLEKEKNKMKHAEEKKKEAADDAADKKLKSMEDGADGADADSDGDHDDADQDKALIKKMLKKHLGDDSDESEVEGAHEAYQHLKSEGVKHEAALKMAADHMKLAKAMMAKKEAAKKDDGGMEEDAKIDDYGYKYVEGEEGEEGKKEKKKESEFLKLKGEVARLRESLRKRELAEYLEKKLAASGLPRAVTKTFKESVGSVKSTTEVDHALELFLEGYKATRGASVSFVTSVEKQIETGNGKLSLADCIKD